MSDTSETLAPVRGYFGFKCTERKIRSL